MSKWHYICEEEIRFPKDDDIRNGKYYCYHVDTWNYLINNFDWVHQNDAFDEHEWLLDSRDNHLESNSGDLIYVPTFEVNQRIEDHNFEILMGEV